MKPFQIVNRYECIDSCGQI